MPSIYKNSRRRQKIWAITNTYATLPAPAFQGPEKQVILQEVVKLIISSAPFPGAVQEGWSCDSENVRGLEIHRSMRSGAEINKEKQNASLAQGTVVIDVSRKMNASVTLRVGMSWMSVLHLSQGLFPISFVTAWSNQVWFWPEAVDDWIVITS